MLLPLSRESPNGRLNWAGRGSQALLSIAMEGAQDLGELNLKRTTELSPDEELLQYEKYIDNPRDSRQLIALALRATSNDSSSIRRVHLLADTKKYYCGDDAGGITTWPGPERPPSPP